MKNGKKHDLSELLKRIANEVEIFRMKSRKVWSEMFRRRMDRAHILENYGKL